jgi:guanine nucleotide-binding protein subunit alpha
MGGLKSERRKWIHTFNDATAIIFMASLNGYDKPLVEDRSKVRIVPRALNTHK